MEYKYSNNQYLDHNCPIHDTPEPAECYTCFESASCPHPPVFPARIHKSRLPTVPRQTVSQAHVDPTVTQFPLARTALPFRPSQPTFGDITSSLPRPIFLDPFSSRSSPTFLRVAPKACVQRKAKINDLSMNWADHRTDFWFADGKWIGYEEYQTVNDDEESSDPETVARAQRRIREDIDALDTWRGVEAYRGEREGWVPESQQRKRKRDAEGSDTPWAEGMDQESVNQSVTGLNREVALLEEDERARKRKVSEDARLLREIADLRQKVEELEKMFGAEQG